MRYELFRAARDRGVAFLQLHVACSPQEALDRNGRRSGGAAVPPDALLRMAEALEPPQPERFPWEAASLTAIPAMTGSWAAMAAEEVEDGSASGGNGAKDGSGDLRSEHGKGIERQQKREPERGKGEEGKGRTASGSPGHARGPVLTDTAAAVCAALWRLWGPPPPPPPSEEELQRQREAGRAANAASHLHSLDLRSRRALSAAVAAAPLAIRAVVARELNERRRVLLVAAREALQLLPLPPVLPARADSVGDDGDAGIGDGDDGRHGERAGSSVGGRSVAADESCGGVLGRLRELEAAFMRAAGLANVEEQHEEGGPGSAATGSAATGPGPNARVGRPGAGG